MIRKRGGSLQVQVFAGRDPLTGRKRWLSRQVRGQTKAAWREAKLLVGRAGQPDTSLRSVCIAGIWPPPAARPGE